MNEKPYKTTTFPVQVHQNSYVWGNVISELKLGLIKELIGLVAYTQHSPYTDTGRHSTITSTSLRLRAETLFWVIAGEEEEIVCGRNAIRHFVSPTLPNVFLLYLRLEQSSNY